MESFFIEKYKSYIGYKDCNGYNSTIGGDGTVGVICSKRTKNKLKKIFTGTKSITNGFIYKTLKKEELLPAGWWYEGNNTGKKHTKEHIKQ